MTERRYADPTALRRAVTDRFRTLARDRRAQLADLQRQFAYDRLLARVSSASRTGGSSRARPPSWPGWAVSPGTRSTSTSTAPAIHSQRPRPPSAQRPHRTSATSSDSRSHRVGG